ncbi:MAG TPA: hypothetical protein VE863_08435 [Pyrinomonadaceae bacterium]|jgi:hypothetical protein|nr:hypothetical protein [Pyrinomonadaceae bacterium]
MKVIAITSVIVWLSISVACGSWSANSTRKDATSTQDEKHRLYAAALAATDSPLDSEVFRRVCQQINIFDDAGKPNERYVPFVSDHINWTLNPESETFRRQISTREKAQDYIREHLPR